VGDVYIAGAAMTRVGRREDSLPDLMAEAGQGALAAAGLERPDALVVSAMIRASVVLPVPGGPHRMTPLL
jgi:acetyl-CoA acetyltransferase